ncbi:MAG: serine/threonine protein kinase [Verrucomicrobiae bacterium]|nr:serine/threonine protein kinase [Verrucomicrobiae bacterium]
MTQPSGRPPVPFTAGQRVFERYYLKRALGSGGMSVVWLAHDREWERLVVLKFLAAHLLADAREIERLRVEAVRSEQLIHPNIVRVYDFLRDAHGVAVAMEYVDGWSLWSMKVDKPGLRFSREEISPWLRDLGAALTFAHAAGIVHRDIKPSNLILDSRGRLKLADFGLARSLRAHDHDPGYHRVIGTDWYMSPQQWTGDAPAVSDDIYSLGVTIYELLTGKPPFHDGDVFQQLHEIIPPTMSERLIQSGVRKPKIPLAWDETVAACLEKEPAHRPANVAEVLTRLQI